MKKFTWTKIFAWIFILITISIFWYQISDYLGTLKSFSIPEKIVVNLYSKEENYVLDPMNIVLINGNKYVVLDTTHPYQGVISPKNNQMYSYDKKFLSKGGNLSLASWKVIFRSINDEKVFLWTSDNKYYVKFNFSFGKESSPIDMYIYSLEENKWVYLGLIDNKWVELKVEEIVWIVK